MTRLLALAAVLATIFVGLPEARAWECSWAGCAKWCNLPVRYGLGDASPDLGDATTITELRRGFDDWTAVSCTGLTTSYTGRSGSYMVNWLESGWTYGSGAIGVTGTSASSTCIVHAEMDMNGVNYTWITGSGRGSNVNAYSIILHEAGHYYGLDHSDLSSAAMYYAYQGGIDALGADDQNGICALYPGSGGGTTDCTTTGCPSGQTCQSGTCVADMGDGSYCSTCSSDGECGGNGDYCIPYANGRFCGQSCSSSADCPAGAECYGLPTSTGGTVNQCLSLGSGSNANCDTSTGCRSAADCAAGEICDGTGTCIPQPTGGSELGTPCEESAECNSGLCAFAGGQQVCTQGCSDLQPATSCPVDFYCQGGAVCGDGLCVRGGTGAGGPGAACTEDTDCATLLCDRGTCSQPCQIGGATLCESGYECQAGVGNGCGACKPEGSVGGLGDPCTNRDECSTQECAFRAGAGFCTNYCDETTTCPDGFACTAVDEMVSICLETEGAELRDNSGCGCSVPGATHSGSKPLWIFLIVVPALVWWRRRRHSRCG
ncbi:MAG: hypothetical protein CMN30_00510 [Sandaracinus sp.]|nr:hypothetical protein [Sandaracinus sp.]